MLNHTYQPQIIDLTIPYTYFLKWTKTNKQYYGVRHAKKSYVGDIMKDYFTSSKTVKEYLKENGLPDLVLVHKCFDTREEALKYEHEFLLFNNAAQSEEWLNRSNGAKTFCNCGHSEETKKKMCESHKGNKGKAHSEETKKKMSIANKGKKHPLYGKTHSEAAKRKMCEKAKSRPKILCPHCNRVFSANTFKRWHGDNCKLNLQNKHLK